MKENIKTEQQLLKINADIYKIVNNMEEMCEKLPDVIPKRDIRSIKQGIKEMKDILYEGEDK